MPKLLCFVRHSACKERANVWKGSMLPREQCKRLKQSPLVQCLNSKRGASPTVFMGGITGG